MTRSLSRAPTPLALLVIAAPAIPTHKAVKGARLAVVKDGPHGVTWTHAEQVNHALVEFLGS